MISIQEIIDLHNFSIRDYGGKSGIRDIEALKSAAERPFQTFAGEELYASPFEKAAALMESILKNHPFIDGNKRTAFASGFHLLLQYNLKINTSNNNAYQLIIDIVISKITYKDLVIWLENNTTELK